MAEDPIVWEKLSIRALPLRLRGLLYAVLPIAVVILVEGGTPSRGAWLRAAIVAGIFVLIALSAVARLLSTTFAVTETGLEVHTGVFRRSTTTLPRERIRRYDTSAGPLQRLLRITTVRIAAAGGETVELDALTREAAARLRQRLHPQTDQPSSDAGVLAQYQGRWVRYAPLTLWGIAGIGALIGLLRQGANFFNIPTAGILTEAEDFAATVPLVWILALSAGILLLAGTALSMVTFLLQWHGYVLRNDGTNLVLNRGALTTKHLSVRQDRIIGVDLIDTVLTRPARAARVQLIAAGLGAATGEDESNGALKSITPVIERRTAVTLTQRLLGLRLPERSQLIPRPPAALRRQLIAALRSALMVALLCAAFWYFLPGPFALLSTVLGSALVAGMLVLAVLGHRTRRHLLTQTHLISSEGTLIARTSVIHRSRIIGFASRQSWFQRRSGLITLTAVIASTDTKGIIMWDLAESDAADMIRDVLQLRGGSRFSEGSG